MDETISTIMSVAATVATLILAYISYTALKQSHSISRRLIEIEELKNIPKLIIPGGEAYIFGSGQGSFDLKNIGGVTAFIRSVSISIDHSQVSMSQITQHELPTGTTNHNDFSAEPQERYASIVISVKYAIKQDKDCAANTETFTLMHEEKDCAGTIIFKLTN